MYAFGGAYAKSCSIRCNSEADATDATYTLRGRGQIFFTGPDGTENKIRMVSGFDDRTNGEWGEQVCFARWSNQKWKLNFRSRLMQNDFWRSVRFHWNALIDTKTADADFEYDSEEETDGQSWR